MKAFHIAPGRRSGGDVHLEKAGLFENFFQVRRGCFVIVVVLAIDNERGHGIGSAKGGGHEKHD